jgi:hypothetical protein
VSRIYIPAQSADDWKRLLADPVLHWKIGRSARTLANCWQDVEGFPQSFAAALSDADLDLELLLALPEHRVPLPGGSRPSQTDLFVLARDGTGALITIAVEGKAGEAFGPLVSEWLRDDQGGKTKRLAYLLETLGLPSDAPVDALRYQLLHRTASAVIEAGRFNAEHAMMVVHAFGDDRGGFTDYERFAKVIGALPERGRMVPARSTGEISLWLGWIDGEPRYLEV